MRARGLKTLLDTLRGAGVTEYEYESGRTKVRLKLGAAPRPAVTPKKEPTADEDMAMRALRAAGLTPEQAADLAATMGDA